MVSIRCSSLFKETVHDADITYLILFKQRRGNQEPTVLKFFYILQMLLLTALAGQSMQIGIPFYKTYSPKTYNGGPQNWDIVQDNRGIIYIGNSYGILEFDGTTWRLIPTKMNTDITNLCVDSKGVVYAASQSEFGYITANIHGEPVFQNLSDTSKTFRGRIINIESEGRDLFIFTDSSLYRFSDGHIEEVGHPAGYAIYKANDKVYFSGYDNKTYEWNGDSLAETRIFKRGDEIFWLSSVSPDSSRTVFLYSINDNLFYYKNGRMHEIKTNLSRYFKKVDVVDIAALENGLLALILDPYGVVIINQKGELVFYFDIQSNLIRQGANSLFRDNQGGLWIGLNDGLMRLEYPSPYMNINTDMGLRGGVSDIVKYKGELFVTTLGRFYKISGTKSSDQVFNPDLSGRFGIKEFEEIRSWCWGMSIVHDQLFVITDDGIYLYKDNRPRLVIKGTFFSLAKSETKPDIIYFSGTDTVFAYQITSRSQKLLSVTKVSHGTGYALAEDPSGDLWIASYEHGFFRLHYESVNRPAQIKRYGIQKGLPSLLNNSIFRLKNRLFFLTEKGLMVLDTVRDKLVRDTTSLGLTAGQRLYLKMFEYQDNILLGSRDSLYYLVKDEKGHYSYDDTTFSRIAHNLFEAVYTEQDGTVWFGLGNGVIQYNPRISIKHRLTNRTLLRRISFGGKELYGGMMRAFRKKSGRIISSGTPVMYHPFRYSQNSAYFKFSLPSFDGSESNQYQYRLIGFDSTFSHWTNNPEKEYTNLEPGKYTFEVLGKNTYNLISQPTKFSFEILAPWYANTWAYTTYLFFLISVVYLIVSWRSRTLKKLVTQRTAELTETNQQLREAKIEAERATHFKSLFLANMSHEIRTPLNGIIGMNSLLKTTSVNEEQKDFLEAINVSAESLLSIVNDILDFSKIEAGKLDIENVTFSLRQIIEDVTSLCKVNGKPKNIQIHSELPDDLPPLLTGDPVRIRQILLNFTTNALKFTDKGHITIRVEKLENTPECTSPDKIALRFSVEDTGIGIAREKQAHIFDSFQQADLSTTRKYGGTGLGLTICKMLTDLMDGDIGVESTPDIGSTFWFTLCLPVVESEESRSDVPSGESYSSMDILKNIHVLVAEDNLINQKVMTRILTKNGISHSLVNNGREAVQFIQDHDCDLILMDIQMPEMDGIEATQAIRALSDEFLNTIPIIALTANAVKGDKERCLAAGMDDYLSKPVNVETMLLLLKKYGAKNVRSAS